MDTNIFLGVLTLIVLAVLIPLSRKCHRLRGSEMGGGLYDIFQVVAASLLLSMVSLFISANGYRGLGKKLDDVTVAIRDGQRELYATLASLSQKIAVLEAKSEPQLGLGVLQPNLDVLDDYLAAVLAQIERVELDPQYEPAEFEGGAIGMTFNVDVGTPNDKVPIRAMNAGVIKSVGPDRDPAFRGRFEVVLDHGGDDGYQTYYGLLYVWSPRLQDLINSTDDPNLQNLVGTEVRRGELLAWVMRSSPASSVRLGLRKKDGTPLSPLKAIGGFNFTEAVKVE